MKIYDSKGRMYVPDSTKDYKDLEGKKILIDKCYCKNGHNLISPRVKFGDFNGILLKAKNKKCDGYIALSPVWGDKSRITIDIDFCEGDLIDLYCPECNTPLSRYSKCDCDGDMVIFFLDKNADYSKCVGICNRLGCPHSELKKDSLELFYFSRKKAL